ncbi:MAG: hypothetical protein HY908_11420 [Myxococcales bacterium]|nr:hypothetical protein [Myxococcales bacterium]
MSDTSTLRTHHALPGRARSLSLVGLVLVASACGGGGAGTPDAGKPQEVQAEQLAPAVALISAYRPHLKAPPPPDKFYPKRRGELERAGAAAANGIRHAANMVGQKLDPNLSPVAKELVAAFQAVSGACADALEDPAIDKCVAAVDALDAALVKHAAVGGATKLPHIAPESITEEAKKVVAPLGIAKGPGTAEQAFFAKRSDPAASVTDVFNACQAASGEVAEIAARYEKAEDPVRITGAMHKMSIEAQCNKIQAADGLRMELDGCRKKPKTPDCKVTCGKARAAVADGVPAAAFAPFEKDVAEICKD